MSSLIKRRGIRSVLCAAILLINLPAATNRLRAAESRHASDHYGRVAFSPDGKQLADGTQAGKIRIWDLRSRRVERVLDLPERRVPDHLAWSADGGQLAVCGFGSPLSIHDVVSGKQLHSVTTRAWRSQSQQSIGNINGLSWHPSGKSLFVSLPRAFVHWDPASAELPTLHWPTDAAQKFYGWHGLIDSAGRQFAMVDEYGKFRLWDLKTGKLKHNLSNFSACQVYLAWNPNDSAIAISSSERVRLLCPETGETIRDIKTPGQSSIVAWSPDGQLLAVAQGWLSRWSTTDKPDKKISLVDPAAGTIIRTLDSGVKNIEFLAWSPDSRKLASGGTSKVMQRDEKLLVRITSNPVLPVSLWEVSSGKCSHLAPPR